MADLSFPTIYLLPTHLEPDELHSLEEQIPSLTYVAREADVLLGKINMKQRAQFELRRLKLPTEEVSTPRPAKRRKTFDEGAAASAGADTALPKLIQVVKLAWFTDSTKEGRVLPLDKYLVYQIAKPPVPTPTTEPPPGRAPAPAPADGHRHGHGLGQAYATRPATIAGPSKRPPLLPETTSEHDTEYKLPPVPDFLRTAYSCQRPTPAKPPNDAFVQELKKVRKIRMVKGDEIGIRAYSTIIASIAAYPHTLSSPKEVERLPGCSDKTGRLFHEWRTQGRLPEVDHARSDPQHSVLTAFYDISGVASKAAHEFYRRGWRDRGDIVEQGWESLTRTQQIGIKYHDELQQKMPRAEVESIANTVLKNANRYRAGHQMVIVGGYRRGKQWSGDADVLISHPSEDATLNLLERLVEDPVLAKYITHILQYSTTGSARGQTPLPWKATDGLAGGGFDTLDKALVVWQDPVWDKSAGDKNPNPHRRVDIIVSPWRTVGCAVLGWTGATTFERDLRRYCKEQKRLRFDSSGIRRMDNGAWVDLESGPDGSPAPDMLTAERRVFEGLGLEWRRPEERCTG